MCYNFRVLPWDIAFLIEAFILYRLWVILEYSFIHVEYIFHACTVRSHFVQDMDAENIKCTVNKCLSACSPIKAYASAYVRMRDPLPHPLERSHCYSKNIYSCTHKTWLHLLYKHTCIWSAYKLLLYVSPHTSTCSFYTYTYFHSIKLFQSSFPKRIFRSRT